MKQNIKGALVYLLLSIITFYLLPIIIPDFKPGLLMLIFPIISFVLTFIHTLKNGFLIWLPIAVIIIFIPSMFIFYNYTAWGYIPIYACVMFLGGLFGHLIHRKG